MEFFCKMKGGAACPPRVGWGEMAWSWLGSFLGMAAVGWLGGSFIFGAPLLFLIGSFGASAVLIHGAAQSPLAQPRNLVGGHVFSALIGVAAWQWLGGTPWLAGAAAVATAILVMHATRTLHPPGGATALIAVIGGPQVHELGYWYALAPVGLGALVMLVVALVVNNLHPTRRYPQFWV